MSGLDPSGTHGPWRKYRCTCGYRCVGDFRANAHEHEMTLDGEAARLGEPAESWSHDVPEPS